MQSQFKPNASGILVPERMADGLENIYTGLGTAKSKRYHSQFTLNPLSGYQQLDAAYQCNWIAGQIVDAPAEDAVREWRSIKCNDSEEIKNHETAVGVANAVQEALCWARLYGGGAVLMVTDQPLDKRLNLNKIKKDSLKKLLVFDRWDMSANDINMTDVLADNYLMPELYMIANGDLQAHWSHFARFTGTRLPLRQRRALHGWGDSVLTRCMDDIKDMVAAKDGIAELMQQANIDVLSKEGLYNAISSDEDDEIVKRYDLFNLMKSNINMALLDSTEEITRHTLQLSGVAPIIETFMTWISGAARIPATRLFGSAAKGLNATGEGDRKNYDNDVRSIQTSQIAPGLAVLDQVLVRSALGFMPDDFDYTWNPLAQQSDVEIAQGCLMRAQAAEIYHDMGVVRPSQIQRNLQANEEYQYDDEAISQLEELEDPLLLERDDNQDIQADAP